MNERKHLLTECPKCDGTGGVDDAICSVCQGLEIVPTSLYINLIGNTVSDLAEYVVNNGYPHTDTKEEIKKVIRTILSKRSQGEQK